MDFEFINHKYSLWIHGLLTKSRRMNLKLTGNGKSDRKEHFDSLVDPGFSGCVKS